MPLVWRDQMSVGNDLIDQDHRYLICLVNSIELVLKHGDDAEALSAFVQQLVSYTQFHFRREEMIQKKMLYPQLGAHANTHNEILTHVQKLQQDVLEHHQHVKDSVWVENEREMITQRVMNLLREWVLNHLLVEDKRMEPYLRKLPANFE